MTVRQIEQNSRLEHGLKLACNQGSVLSTDAKRDQRTSVSQNGSADIGLELRQMLSREGKPQPGWLPQSTPTGTRPRSTRPLSHSRRLGRPHPSALLKLIGSVSVDVPCERCGHDKPITSRAPRTGSSSIRDNGNWARGVGHLQGSRDQLGEVIRSCAGSESARKALGRPSMGRAPPRPLMRATGGVP